MIIGSACEQGDLYQAIIEEKPEEELIRIAEFYDYLEIQPLGNNQFMVRESSKPDKKDKKTGESIPNKFRKVTSLEVIKDFNRKIVEIADKLGKPVVATGDVHFLKKSDEMIRKILMAGQGFDDFDNQAPLTLKVQPKCLRISHILVIEQRNLLLIILIKSLKWYRMMLFPYPKATILP